MRILSAILISLFAFTAQAEPSPIATAKLLADAPSIKAGTPFHVGLELTITEHWHAYWQNPGDSGMATYVQWQLPEGLSAGEIQWPSPERLSYDTLVNYGYSNKVLLPIAITPSKDMDSATLKVKASWLVCKDICIPESADLEITLPSSEGASDVQAALAGLPKPLNVQASYAVENDRVTLSIPSNAAPEIAAAADAIWFPLNDGIIKNAGSMIMSQEEGALLLRMDAGTSPATPEFKGVLALRDAAGKPTASYQITAALGTIAASTAAPKMQCGTTTPFDCWGFLNALLFAFLGGLILNLMPCVLPVLSLKALALAKKADASKRAAMQQGIAYTLGVVFSFLLIAAVLIALTQAGASIGWGFQLQSPEVVAGLAMLMLVVALNLFGLFEWPVLFASSQAGKSDSVLGSFLTGALAVALATPCTAPFMAPALGFAATQPPLLALSVFAALGLGLAFPFLLISIWPAARRLLPKPGAWMNVFKQLLAFPMLATAIWLLWVQVQLNAAHGLLVTLLGMLGIAFFIWLLRTAQKRSRLWALLALAVAALAIGYQPPVAMHAAASSQDSTPYSAAKLAELRAQNKAVFVDATAAWCITCKINERVALSDDAVKTAFKEKNITLMVADWTMRDAAITEYLASFGRNGVPLYVYYAPGKEGVVLPQILTPSIVLDALTQ